MGFFMIPGACFFLWRLKKHFLFWWLFMKRPNKKVLGRGAKFFKKVAFSTLCTGSLFFSLKASQSSTKIKKCHKLWRKSRPSPNMILIIRKSVLCIIFQCLLFVSPFKMNPNLKDQADQVGEAFARKIRLKSKNWLFRSSTFLFSWFPQT